MLRQAVIRHLIAQVPSLGGRVYEAYLAPAGALRPYATVKLAGEIGDGRLGAVDIEVRLYADRGTFGALDAVEAEVRAALAWREIRDAATGAVYAIEPAASGGDFEQPEDQLIGRLLRFWAAAVRG